ncbi:MAG: hypothetical protein AABY22_25795 [Nanoarchaeota archaeon]
MPKTILFCQPNSPLIQQLQQEGREFILAQDPIKTLRAMKKVKPDEYEVLGDEQSGKYVEFAKKLGYKEPIREDRNKLEEKIKELDEIYQTKVSEFQGKIGEDYKKTLSEMEAINSSSREILEKLRKEKITFNEALNELEAEKHKFKKIKQKIKQEIYG